MDKLTVSERFKRAVGDYEKVFQSGKRHDSLEFQNELVCVIKEFQLIVQLVESLSLFSDNESISELNTAYMPYLNLWFYLANLFSRLLLSDGRISIDNKADFLNSAKDYVIAFLSNVCNYDLLTKIQKQKLRMMQKGEEIVLAPQAKRSEKIENFRKEQALKSKIDVFHQLKNKMDGDKIIEDEMDGGEIVEDETIREMYLDQLQLNILKAFDLFEQISMELQVLLNRPKIQQLDNSHQEVKKSQDPTGYTPNVETNPFSKNRKISDLIDNRGKVLQPFIITNNNKRQELQQRVFGTGQVLPSMSVEEYLDYELANGKLMKEEVKKGNAGVGDDDDEEEDSENDEAQLEKRRWDDWKDENPKGSGNTKGNIG
ncbi:TAP42 [Candida oxycetoniae]|uniref:TAP42 n=1 Tax=Candida oxycetoniae TaxID=497107 RepID=A0AAI9WW64_9ASCO|nr:TAP42 [Candida oxycetoniae]KAI3402618.2 TAP42 [Candida oxycetoniae]